MNSDIIKDKAIDYINNNKFDLAISEIKKVVISANDYALYFLLASSYYYLKNYSEAEVNLKKSINLKSDFPDAHFLLAQIYLDEGKYQEAEKSSHEALELVPGSVDGLSCLAASLLGNG